MNYHSYMKCLTPISSITKPKFLTPFRVIMRSRLNKIWKNTILRMNTVTISAMFSQVLSRHKSQNFQSIFLDCKELPIKMLASRQGMEVKCKAHASSHSSHLLEKIQNKKKVSNRKNCLSKALQIIPVISNPMKLQGQNSVTLLFYLRKNHPLYRSLPRRLSIPMVDKMRIRIKQQCPLRYNELSPSLRQSHHLVTSNKNNKQPNADQKRHSRLNRPPNLSLNVR